MPTEIIVSPVLPMTLRQFQDAACRTINPPGTNHFFHVPVSQIDGDVTPEDQAAFNQRQDLIHAILGLGGEVGELMDPVKKSMFYGKPLDVENIREEAGDLLWYIAGPLCRALNCTLEDLARQNVAKLKRRYPEKYTDQAAIDRADKK